MEFCIVFRLIVFIGIVFITEEIVFVLNFGDGLGRGSIMVWLGSGISLRVILGVSWKSG